MTVEIWKNIDGYEGIYQVSSLGNVRSLDRVVQYKNGRNQFTPGRQLKPSFDKDGYTQVNLSKNNKTAPRKIHRLVAIAFIKNDDGKETVNHIDGVKNNNAVTNLEWATLKENMEHASRVIGLVGPWKGKFGAANKSSKPVFVDGVFYGGITEAARNINVSAHAICQAARRGKLVKGMRVVYAEKEAA